MKHFFILLFVIPLLAVAGPQKTTSVLSEGRWWKIAVPGTGIYRITYEDMVSMNMSPSVADPSTIRIFGNGGRMLPEANNLPRTDDLRELAIEVADGGDGKMDPGDFILFYATGPDGWNYNYTSGTFAHTNNHYSDKSYYFITYGGTQGKRITGIQSYDSIPDHVSTAFTDHVLYENDSLSLIKSGKQWVGELFSTNKSGYTLDFSFPERMISEPVHLVTSVVARSSKRSYFMISFNNVVKDTVPVDYIDLGSTSVFAKGKIKSSDLSLNDTSFSLNITYLLNDNNSQGWLDYLELSCRRSLSFKSPSMDFRDPAVTGPGKVTRFVMSGAGPQVRIWEVTSEGDPAEILADLAGSELSFTASTDSLKEFIAFDGSWFPGIEVVGEIPNQDLHATVQADMVIITHPLFSEQAERLGAYHRQESNLSVVVADINQIYNEFSSGKKDIGAIRDFMKMLFDRAQAGSKPRYLLLFGDGSYDPKDRIPGNNDFIPTFQSTESLKPISSYITEDFYGIMGPTAGNESNGPIDIGIGRLPVSTPAQAENMVNKILRYSAYSDTACMDWRNLITFVADDENNNVHLQQAEELVEIVEQKYPVYNINKIYLDAYKMIETAAGYRLPDVNKAINNAVEKGTLILNYTGHGGEDGWSGEKVLTIGDISNWDNYYRMPVFVTATCEFSRFDNPERYTAGEMVVNHNNGGAIALYSTTRLSLSTTNFKLDTSFFRNLIPPPGQPPLTMGDLIRISKNRNGNTYAIRNFVLLGDPAQPISFPEYDVVTTAINDIPLDATPDTALGKSSVKIKGEIRYRNGEKVSSFNGEVFPKFFDKPVNNLTIGNTPDSYPQIFQTQDVILYSGIVPVNGGDFEFSFKVPSGVAPQIGKGKLNYYARDGVTDANGYCTGLVTGGEDPGAQPDFSGPQIALYMDDLFFRNGGLTGKDTRLIAHLEDPEGINFFNLGIGHQITAWLDDNHEPFILNEYYKPESGIFGKGQLEYPLSDLSTGRHTLTLKCWDLFNNSSEKSIIFFVHDPLVPAVSALSNYPNPFRGNTVFTFMPDKNSGQLDISLIVYTTTGQPVWTFTREYEETNGQAVNISWDGTGDFGQNLAAGLYIYQLTAYKQRGEVIRMGGKLVKVD